MDIGATRSLLSSDRIATDVGPVSANETNRIWLTVGDGAATSSEVQSGTIKNA